MVVVVVEREVAVGVVAAAAVVDLSVLVADGVVDVGDGVGVGPFVLFNLVANAARPFTCCLAV